MNPGRAGIRNDDPGRTENRQAADNAEPPIERLGRKRLAARDGNLDFSIASVSALGRDLANGIANHLSRYRIDRGFARRNRKTGTRHRADSFASPEHNAAVARAEAYGGTNKRSVRHVGIVPRILDDTGGRRVFILPRHRQGETRPFAARQFHLDRIGEFAGHQSRKSRLRGGGSASAGGPSPAQRALLLRHAAFFSPTVQSRHYRSNAVRLP